MPAFTKILVGVDLSQTEPLGSVQFRRPVQTAIDAALVLAEANHAALTFFAAIEFHEYVPHLSLMAEEAEHTSSPLADAAEAVLDHWLAAAATRGISANRRVEEGTGWAQMIRYVQRTGIDLVIAGTRNQAGITRFMLGSTSQKLLRNCPCTVLVTKPGTSTRLARIAVASDLTPVSQKVLKTAVDLAGVVGAKVHLIHAVDFPLDRMWVSSYQDLATRRYHDRVRDDALRRLKQSVARLGRVARGVEIAILDGVGGAGSAILEYVDRHKIDLLALGTVGRSGVSGIVIGNTAERLLHELPCNMLAVKPDDFQCPLPVAATPA